MYRVVVIAGPSRGANYDLAEGQTTFGRKEGNTVVLSSNKVSKQHCSLTVGPKGVELQDLGSSNGTFVNGVLVKQKILVAGDRVSVGDFVLQLSGAAKAASVSVGGGNVLEFPQPGQESVPQVGLEAVGGGFPVESCGGDIFGGGSDPLASSVPGAGDDGVGAGIEIGSSAVPDGPPPNFWGKIVWAFDRMIMPFFYQTNMKTEWRLILVGLLGLLVVLNVVISVYPLVEANSRTVLRETVKRGMGYARQITESNAQVVASGSESNASIGYVAREPGVIAAILVDLENRIIAPTQKINQYLASGPIAQASVKAASRFKSGTENSQVFRPASDLIVTVEPLKVLNPRLGRNVVVAMAVVAIDTSIAKMDLGTVGIVYSQTFIAVAVLAIFIFIVIYRLSLKPFEVLNEEIDSVLKGNGHQVTNEFKHEELDTLWAVINSALQRVGHDDASASGGGGPTIDDFSAPIQALGESAGFGVLLADEDRRIVYINTAFEDASGINSIDAQGQDLPSVARDQALGALATDMFDQVQMGGKTEEEFDFSGVQYKMVASSFGAAGAKGFVLFAIPTVGGDDF